MTSDEALPKVGQRPNGFLGTFGPSARYTYPNERQNGKIKRVQVKDATHLSTFASRASPSTRATPDEPRLGGATLDGGGRKPYGPSTAYAAIGRNGQIEPSVNGNVSDHCTDASQASPSIRAGREPTDARGWLF